MSSKTVKCIKLGEDLPALDKAPFSGEMGKKIFETVSKKAWDMWQEVQIKILNEYRLNMADPDDYQVLVDQMMTFLNLKEGESVEIGNEKRGRS